MRTCRDCYANLGEESFYSSRWSICRPCARAANRARRREGRIGPRVGTYDRAFGVELEFIGSMRAVSNAVIAAGYSCPVVSYGHRPPPGGGWKIVPDASVYGGGELVSPKLQGAAGIAEMKTVVQAASVVATVNRKCGMHVHLDATGESLDDIKKFIWSYVSRQAGISGLVAPSRRSNSCDLARAWTAQDIERLDSISDLATLRSYFPPDSGQRYRTVNVCSYARHGTVEVRQHQGTLNPAKVEAWVRFAQAMWTVDAAPSHAEDDTYAMLDAMSELDAETREYLRSRAYSFRRAAVA